MLSRRTRHRGLGLGLAIVLSITGAACGDDDDEGEDTATTAAAAGSPTVDIEMKDYAYAVSGTLTEGGTIRAKNTGKELHMITVSKFKPGKTLTDLIEENKKAFAAGGEDDEATTTSVAGAGGNTTTSGAAGEEGEEEEEPESEVVDEVKVQGGSGIFQPGAPAVELTGHGLEPGTYALQCFINVEGTQDLHVAKGMLATLRVVKGTAPAAPTADATYKIEKGKAITGPTTLTAGRHVLKLEATGTGAGDLEPALFKPNAGKTFADANRVFESWDETGVPKGGVAMIPGLLVAALFDLSGQTTYYVATDFTPGTYFLVASDTDVEKQPDTPKELITIKVA